MSKNINPVVAVIVAILVLIVVVVFGYKKMSGTGLTKTQEEKYLTPLKLPEKGQMPNLTPPPAPGGPGMPGGGGPGTMPVPQSPPRGG